MGDTNLETWITENLIEIISEVQRQCGREVPLMTSSVVPLTDMGGFDTLNATEACVLLSVRLDVKISPHLFASDSGQPLTVGAIARAIANKHRADIERVAAAAGAA